MSINSFYRNADFPVIGYHAKASELFRSMFYIERIKQLLALAFQSVSLEQFLDRKEDSFKDRLFKLIDQRGLTDAQVYKKANMCRQDFSKLRNGTVQAFDKERIFALAIAMELTLSETVDLLQRAGKAMKPDSIFDRIIEYCITHQIYNFHQVNQLLYEYGERSLIREI